MADVKITQLPAALSVNDTDNLILDDGSSTYRVAADMLKKYMVDDISAAANKNLAPAYNASSTYTVGDLVTYQGKLYKCIVAVTVPEDFNINKWDDVTTSEAYGRKAVIVSTAQTDGTTLTYEELVLSLFEGVDRDVTKEYLLIVERANGTVIICHENYISPNDIVFSSILGNGINVNITAYLVDFNNNTAKISDWYMSTSGNTVTDVSSTVISARTLKLYELATI